MGYNVFVFDTEAQRLSDAKDDGFSIWERGRKDHHNLFDFVIGCSGVNSFGNSVEDFKHLAEHSVLVSASSANHELSFDKLVQQALQNHQQQQQEENQREMEVTVLDPSMLYSPEAIHENLDFIVEFDKKKKAVDEEEEDEDEFDLEDWESTGIGNIPVPKPKRARKMVRYLNGGFPLSFSGKINAVESFKVFIYLFLFIYSKLSFSCKIQPTLAMMVGAAVQARHAERYCKPGTSPKGIHLLHHSLDDWIVKEFKALMPHQKNT